MGHAPAVLAERIRVPLASVLARSLWSAAEPLWGTMGTVYTVGLLGGLARVARRGPSAQVKGISEDSALSGQGVN